jgi:adenine C2-methylase RlmN of 23S rRNA A2503 and tRNA A37
MREQAEQRVFRQAAVEEAPSHVNLIPLNPIANYGGLPTSRDIAKHFQAILPEHHIPSTIRQHAASTLPRGADNLAANPREFRELPLASPIA